MAQKKNSDLGSGAPKAVARMMLGTLFSTTWRVFAPVTVLFLIGLAIDLNAPTKPWCSAICTGLGIVISVVLVAAQLKDIRQQSAAAQTGGAK